MNTVQTSTQWEGAWRDNPEAMNSAADDVSRLGWLYVFRFRNGREPVGLVDMLSLLGGNDLPYLRAVRFLHSDPVIALLERSKKILRSLPQTTTSERQTTREARGKIDWPQTVKLQLANGNDRSLLRVAIPNNHYDKPENRCLAYILRKIATAGHGLGLKLRDNSIQVTKQAQRALLTSALSMLPHSDELTASDRQSLRMARRADFRGLVAETISLHDRLFSNDLEGLRKALGEKVWLPPEPDKLFELWCLFHLVEILEADGWDVDNLRLIGSIGATTPEFSLKKNHMEIAVSYQSAHPDFMGNSKYRDLLSIYGVKGALRRPDILISAKGHAATLHMFIEVKLTQNRDYIADSIYKSLGYISDFHVGLDSTPNPKGILLVWDGVQPNLSEKIHDLEILSTSKAGTDSKICSFVEKLALEATKAPSF